MRHFVAIRSWCTALLMNAALQNGSWSLVFGIPEVQIALRHAGMGGAQNDFRKTCASHRNSPFGSSSTRRQLLAFPEIYLLARAHNLACDDGLRWSNLRNSGRCLRMAG